MGDLNHQAQPPGCAPISRKRRITYCVITSVLLLAMLEGVVRIGAAMKGQISLRNILDRQREAAAPTKPVRRGVSYEVVHPYVGYVVDPTVMSGINQYGFLQVDGPILKRRPGQIIIGITGGSVARDVCQSSSATLKRRLQSILGPREIAIVCLAQEGFHQPQQTMAWALFRCLGAEFDYLVNLDGFNEVALHQAETPTDAVWYAYPRRWETRLSDTANPELNRLIGLGVTIREGRMAWARRFDRLRGLPLMSIHLTWSAMDNAFLNQIADVTGRIQVAKRASDKLYSHSGPQEKFQSSDERIAALVRLWGNCSLNLFQMCEGAGTTYLHCLQPNIAFDAKKKRTAKEDELYSPDAHYQLAVKLAYPKLISTSAELRSKEINFEDLTGIYADVAETIYVDDCCHFSQLGDDLLAAAIADGIAKLELGRR